MDSRIGVLLRGVVGVLCWRSGHVWQLVRARASVLGEARGLAWLWCVVARWCLPRLVVSSPGAVRVVAGGWGWAGAWCVGFPGMVPAGGGGVVRSWCGAVSFLCWWAAVSHVPGVGELVRCHVPCGAFR